MTIGAGTVALVGRRRRDRSRDSQAADLGGQSSAVIPPGAPLVSDPVDLPVKPLSSLAVSYLPAEEDGHHLRALGRRADHLYLGQPATRRRTQDFKADSTNKSRLLSSAGILTTAKPESSAIVFFGDSITDGACSTADTNNRWPDHIAERLQKPRDIRTSPSSTRPIRATAC